MSMSDPIADMLTRIRNGQSVNMESVAMPSSNTKVAIATVLRDEGYIVDFRVEERESKKTQLTIDLKYFEGQAGNRCGILKRVSRPGLRIYSSRKDELPKVLGGLGMSNRVDVEGRDDRPRGPRPRVSAAEVLCC